MVNDPFGDPALYVEVLWEHRALLFDLGDIRALRPAKALKVSHAFVSHTHIDHFIGFDALLRVMLNREKVLKVFGPPGFLANVQGKLAGYTWNLTADYPFSVEAAEIHEDRVLTRSFHCQERFVPGEEESKAFKEILEEDGRITVRASHLDHLVPSLAFALEERFHINIHKERVTQMGFSIGPWLQDLKAALWREEKDEFLLQVPCLEKEDRQVKEIPLERLRKLVTITPGQKIAYVADCQYNEKNIKRVLKLVAGADVFFCEAAFLDRDRERAKERAHLTARQAGELAREAKVKRLEIFHFSPKYEKEAKALYREAEEAFRGAPKKRIRD
jgi:ribonuclease Z